MMPKQFQSSTIVPNKSTMVEEDDDAISPTSPDPNGANAYGLRRGPDDRDSKRSAEQFEVCFPLLVAPNVAWLTQK
jgi:hypothetical protein